jgi:hypothetical protein
MELGLREGLDVYALVKSVAIDRRSMGLSLDDAEPSPAPAAPPLRQLPL